MPATYILYTIRLNEEKDKDVIAFLEQQSNKTATIKDALMKLKAATNITTGSSHSKTKAKKGKQKAITDPIGFTIS